MSQAADLREDQVVLSFLRLLRSHSVPAVLVEQPDRLPADRRTFENVTSDSLFRFDGDGTVTWWSCDVMVLAQSFEPEQALTVLHDALEEVAATRSVTFRAFGDLPDLKEVKRIHRYLTENVEPESSGQLDGNAMELSWTPSRPEDLEQVQLALLMPAESSDLADVMAATMSGPLTGKATRQAKPAHLAGCRSAVLLDWEGHEGVRQGTHWIAQSSFTVRNAVEKVLAGVPHYLDAVFLLDRDSEWHTLIGNLLTGDA